MLKFLVIALVAAAANGATVDYETVLRNATLKNPVIIVPGLEGSQLEAKLDKPKTVNWLCSRKTSDWFPIWVDPKEFLPEIINCFLDNFMLTYDPSKRHVQNSPGVQIRPINFGSTEAIEFLTKVMHFKPLGYFNLMVNKLVSVGYERNVNVRGAPYDFRLSPRDNVDFMTDMKKLVEDTVQSQGGKKAMIVCHSMGCLYSLYFLNQMPQQWKDQHILQLTSLGAPWAGAVKVPQR